MVLLAIKMQASVDSGAEDFGLEALIEAWLFEKRTV